MSQEYDWYRATVSLEAELQRHPDVLLKGGRYPIVLRWDPDEGYTGHIREIRLYARGRSLERVLERLRSEVARYESAATSALVM